METPNLSTPPKADWSQLPKDLFDSILERLSSPLDHIRVSCVCNPWRSMAPKFHCWLILPCNYYDNSIRNGEEAVGFLGLVNLSDPNCEVHKLRLAEASGRLVHGSSAGWLVTLKPQGDIHLLHPFTRAHIQLPQLTLEAFPDLPSTFEGSKRRIHIDKAIVGLSSNGASASSSSFETDGVVMVMCLKPKKLAFYRLGKDQNWSSFEGYSGSYKDIAFYKDQLYGIRNRRHVFVACGFDGPSPTMEDVMEIPNHTIGTKYYLVESSGDLLLVLRHLGWVQHKTVNFSVFKLDVGGRNLVKVKNIGNRCLFLDRNTAVSLSASDVPGCKGNHIYYIGTCFSGYSRQSFGCYDMGVFNLKDRAFIPLNYCNDRGLIMHPPIWYPTYP
ncbi:F-box protein SKIP23-like [Telopea speciosissima]|uniref:F-box protein SKIP23-like n=1 Tax=Telopea speciosissima TaxID=54955 RepID=UPI001CC7B3EC|nr:F-box protein SKIP23-like [Telopea speciosissima]